MKSKKLLLIVSIACAFAACKKDSSVPGKTTGGGTTTDTTTTTTPKAYTITETFESGSKTAYADDTVRLSTGVWDFNDALIGNLAGDVKDGSWAVRLRTGSLTTDFDINGVKVISVKHAKYGSDASSTWQMMVSTDGGATFNQLGNTITETSTTLVTDSFTVTTTGKIRIRIQKTGTTRIDLDDITFKGTGDPGVTVTTPSGGDDDSGDGGTTSTGSDRGVTDGSDAPPASGDNSNLLLGNPSNAAATVATGDNYLLNQYYYTESYNATRGEPNWVSWHLDATNTTGVASRQDNFAGFNGLPTGFYEVLSTAYSGSGFDRGHNCPSADRTSSTDANSATFLMTNMIPQAPQNNQQTWANLENFLRDEVNKGNEIYIIMGSYGTGGTGSAGAANTVNSGHVTVPSNVWKVAVIIPTGNSDISRITASTRVIAVNTPNINTINSDWTQYITTVRDIEAATGYNLFSVLPQDVQDAIETKKDNGAL